jgi:hypothetical protein
MATHLEECKGENGTALPFDTGKTGKGTCLMMADGLPVTFHLILPFDTTCPFLGKSELR